MVLNALLDSLKLCLLLGISSTYLTFCWVVQYRTILVPSWGLVDTSPKNLGDIKSGITSINILIFLLALWPIKSLIIDLKQEEFVRLLRQSNAGHGSRPVNLATANSLSSTSSGIFKIISIILKRSCSSHFIVAFVCSIVVMATSTLAPAALSVQKTSIGSNVMSFNVAAIPASSVATIDPRELASPQRYAHYSLTSNMQDKVSDGYAVAWGEIMLGMDYSFSPPMPNSSESPRYLIPLPVNISQTTSVKWLTDILVMRPSCSWQPTEFTEPISLDDLLQSRRINLPRLNVAFDSDVLTRFRSSTYGIGIEYASARSKSRYTVFNSTTGDVPAGGYAIWVISQFHSTAVWPLSLDLTELPTFVVTEGESISSNVAILVCSPNFSIKTTVVENQWRDIFIRQDRAATRDFHLIEEQGNLDHREAEFFFTVLLGKHVHDENPNLFGADLRIQAGLIFGWDQVIAFNHTDYASPPVTWSPAPISNITAMYGRFLQSLTKPYLTGALGTADVPGIISTPVVAFAASRAHTVASTILLLLLNAFNIWSFFRSGKGEAFSLFTAASVLHGSNVPGKVKKFREENHAIKGEGLERKFEDESKNRFIHLDNDEVLVLYDGDVCPLDR